MVMAYVGSYRRWTGFGVICTPTLIGFMAFGRTFNYRRHQQHPEARMTNPDPTSTWTPEQRYESALARGLSEHEAREEGWPQGQPTGKVAL
jgi:hypothetical protein